MPNIIESTYKKMSNNIKYLQILNKPTKCTAVKYTCLTNMCSSVHCIYLDISLVYGYGPY